MSLTELDQNRTRAGSASSGQARSFQERGTQPGSAQQGTSQEQPKVNVGSVERAVSVAAGSVLALTGLGRRTIPGLLIAGFGGALAYRGVTGHCSMYQSLGIDTSQSQEGPEQEIAERGIHVEQSFLVNRPASDLYRFWRNFENLPGIMYYLESVRTLDERRSHWVAQAPAISGGTVEWDAEITADEPDRRIAWRSLPGSQIDTIGEIRFSQAMGDRGTEVHVSMEYVPPGGRLGHWVATLFGKAPRRQMREDLRNFKRLMECGEIPTIDGQPRGTCTGHGKREHSS